jgi:hypothetical protein
MACIASKTRPLLIAVRTLADKIAGSTKVSLALQAKLLMHNPSPRQALPPVPPSPTPRHSTTPQPTVSNRPRSASATLHHCLAAIRIMWPYRISKLCDGRFVNVNTIDAQHFVATQYTLLKAPSAPRMPSTPPLRSHFVRMSCASSFVIVTCSVSMPPILPDS